MEVLDPSISRDDQPLCVNDFLEKGMFLIFCYYINYTIYFHLYINFFFNKYVYIIVSLRYFQKPRSVGRHCLETKN